MSPRHSDVESARGRTARSAAYESPDGSQAGNTIDRSIRAALSHRAGWRAHFRPRKAQSASAIAVTGKKSPSYLANAIASCRRIKRRLVHFAGEFRQFESDDPRRAGTGRIGEIVPPIAGCRLRTNVGSPSLGGHLFVADAWHSVISRLLRSGSHLLDIGCGCGKTARTLIYHPYVRHYTGFDAIRENIEWCAESIAPLCGGRFEFHYLDVHSERYNPGGILRGTDVVFPAASGVIDFAFAASVFTHLLEEDATHYLHEVRRTLAPDGVFLCSVYTNPAPGTQYSGNEVSADIDCRYLDQLARAAGLKLEERLGSLCGQETFLFGRA